MSYDTIDGENTITELPLAEWESAIAQYSGDYIKVTTSTKTTVANSGANITKYPIPFTSLQHASEDFELGSDGWVECKRNGKILVATCVGCGYGNAYTAGYVLAKDPDKEAITHNIGSSMSTTWALGYSSGTALIDVAAGTKISAAGYSGLANQSTQGTYIYLTATYL